MTAQDVHNNRAAAFNSLATLTSTGTLLGGPVTTAAFVNGVLAAQSVTITSTGSFTLAATSAGKTGTSSAFAVRAGVAHHLASRSE